MYAVASLEAMSCPSPIYTYIHTYIGEGQDIALGLAMYMRGRQNAISLPAAANSQAAHLIAWYLPQPTSAMLGNHDYSTWKVGREQESDGQASRAGSRAGRPAHGN